ncbi:MAG: ABC transporter ATP-binding protein, partial [Candidatus Margulisbacteria bacterium]|nr:ABC transporter ATP-binding protein [Candidatus Margulisiibacteriota bacterium]
STLYAASNVFFIPLMRDLSDVIAKKDIWLFNLNVAYIGILYALRLLAQLFQTYLMAYISNRITIDLRVDFFRHIQSLSLDFYEKYRTGDITSRVFSDVGMIESVICASFASIIPQALTFIGILGYLLFINYKLTLLMFVVLPFFFYLIEMFGRRTRRYSSKIQRKSADIFSVLQESLAGVRIVKAFSMENESLKRFTRENERNFKFAMKNVRIAALQEPVFGFLQFIAIVVIFWYGFTQVVVGQMELSQLIAFITGIFLLVDPIITLSKVYSKIQQSLASAERVFQVMDIIPTVQDKKNAIELDKLDGKIEFKNVSFSYNDGDGIVLKNMSVVINPGETVALVGPSGSGKTTFINLVSRFYDVNEGALLIDDIDIRDIKKSSYINFLGIVPQETILFRGSVENNIAYGKPGATREEVVKAAQVANAEEFILKMKNKYVTRIGEKGQKLSGGQKQRMAIARAVLKNPKILILDEATSSLDNESEQLVQDALDKLMKNRTTLVIAHRLSTIINADRILVIVKGEIAEQGTHEELLTNNGMYKKLYEKNFK